jgi:polyhydroxyalkanoate synthesis repressor PhaR
MLTRYHSQFANAIKMSHTQNKTNGELAVFCVLSGRGILSTTQSQRLFRILLEWASRSTDERPDPMTNPASDAHSQQVQIRKYPNRRYYDTNRSRHVTLEEIYGLIREGYNVQVTDSKTGRDITAKVLAQIIIELDSPKLDVFPVAMLHRLLRSNEQIVQDFVQRYFNEPLSAFLESHRSAEQMFRKVVGLQSPAPTMADWAKMFFGQLAPSRDASAPAAAPALLRAGEDQSDLRRLVEELRQEVRELTTGAPAKKPRRARGRSAAKSSRAGPKVQSKSS